MREQNAISFLKFFSFVFVIVFWGCQSNSTKNKKNTEQSEGKLSERVTAQFKEIDPRKFEDNELCLSLFTDDIKYIPLSNKIPIGDFYVFRVTSNAIYLIYDNSGGGEGNGHPQLFRFDINGKNPVEIGSVGRGPREYLSANYFAVDEANNRIYINGKLNTVLVFDTLGNYIRDFKFKTPEIGFSKMDFLSNNRLFLPQQSLGAQRAYLWYVTDTLGNVISRKKNSIPPFETHTGSYSGTFKYKDKISYWIDYNDTIFEVSPGLSCQPSYLIAPNENRLENLKSTSPTGMFLKPSEFYLPRFFTETNKYLINRYSYNGKYAFTFIDKKSGETYTCNYKLGEGGITNDFDAGLKFFPLEYFSDGKDENLISIIQSLELKIYVTSDEFKNSTPKYPEMKKALEQLANRLNENDNPVLMLVKLKE
ncbi:6-bladed beta-propeller [Maribellus maritimus]|uniref:6-bladed beta-propeller n=1 Tax=Maribellus maritimus TaxID=2870838 RepID=UPI001EEAEDB5|nr:6-bladed beta-propeller [Maribellus maritimus]MCG6189361.1 6-bladed beta-propeller [Maribellus maritimus]